MKETMIIAWREYAQYVFSRGFLLLIFLGPIGLLALFSLLTVAQSSVPVRSYLIVDQAGQYADEVENFLTRTRLRRTIAAWDAFVEINSGFSGQSDDALPAPFAPAPITRERERAFQDAGGLPAAREAARGVLAVSPDSFEGPKARYVRRDLTGALEAQLSENGLSENKVIDSLRPYLLGEQAYDGDAAGLYGVLIIPDQFGKDGDVPAQYWGRNLVDTDLKDDLKRALDWVLQREAAQGFGLSDANYSTIITTRAVLNSFRPDRASEEAALNLRDRIETTLPAAMTYVLFILIFSVGSLLLTNTIEERSNKIVEMLLSSVTADQLMLGKLIGIGAVGLTIPAIGLILSLVGAFTVFAGNELVTGLIATVLLSPLIWIYLFYFLCGYVIFAMMYLAIGAISNSLQDAQTFLGPVTLIVMAPLPLMVMVFQDPNGLVASIMTWIPFYTPYAVMLRAASGPPLWEIIGATVFMLVFGAFFVSLMGRIFRRGLLNDSPPNLRALIGLAAGRG